jgi:hypothetical protein
MLAKSPFWMAGLFVMLAPAVVVQAQLPEMTRRVDSIPDLRQQVENGEPSPSDVSGGVHPDLVSHMNDLRRYEESRSLAQLAAIEKAEQRRARLAAARWYGHSPLRPIVSSLPVMGDYFPAVRTDVHRPVQWFQIRASSGLE